MAIKPEVVDWWKRQAWLPQISRPGVIQQPQTGQTYRRPSSVSEYFLGESEEDRKKRELRRILAEQAAQRGNYPMQPSRANAIQRMPEGEGEGRGDSLFVKRLKQANAEEPDGPELPGVIQGRLQNRGRSNQTARLIGNEAAASFQKRFDAADPNDPELVTQAEKNIDSVIGPRKRMSQQNIRAHKGRVPGYMPELTSDEQDRVSRRLMGAARGGMVDETSPLNGRGAAFALAAARDRSREAQQQEEQQAMSKRFRSLWATRTRDGDGNLNAPVESSTSTTRQGSNNRGTVTTIAEKIAGVEDDPSTPMDESIRYRAEWNGIDPKRLRQQRSEQVRANRARRKDEQQQGRDAVMSGRLAAMSGKPPEATGNDLIDRIAKRTFMRQMENGEGPMSEFDRFRQAMGQAMAFDAANQGKTQLASTLMGKFGDYRVQDLAGRQQKELLGSNPDGIDDNTLKAVELEANLIVEQLNGMPPNDPRRRALELDLANLRKRLQSSGAAAPQAGPATAPQTLEEQAKAAAAAAVSESASAANSPGVDDDGQPRSASPQKAAEILWNDVQAGNRTIEDALTEARTIHGAETTKYLMALHEQDRRN